VRGLRSINERSQDLRRASTITVKWQAENPEDRLRSATMADGRQGWSRSKWTAVPMAGTSAEAAQSPAHGQARRLYCNPHCGGSFGPREARAGRIGRLTKNFPDPKVTRLKKQISSLSPRDETPSSTTGPNEIIDDCFWISYNYQELSSKIGRAGRLLALLGLPLSSNAEEWLRLRLILRGGTRIARWR
jgi:hypothetical protein